MNDVSGVREYTKARNPALRGVFALMLGVMIAVVGWGMMTIGSSPTVKGASFIWLPAALQLVAGVWLGPFWGFIAGGLGAYGAGILAYGGWGLVDIIMNPIAGGLANAVLPYFMFRWLKIDPAIGVVDREELKRSIPKFLLLSILVLGAGLVNIYVDLPKPEGWEIASPLGYLLPIFVLFIGARMILGNLSKGSRGFTLALIVAIAISAISALIGVVGAMVGGKPFAAAMIDPFIGWFAGDTVSVFLGVYLLMLFTSRIRETIGVYGEE